MPTVAQVPNVAGRAAVGSQTPLHSRRSVPLVLSLAPSQRQHAQNDAEHSADGSARGQLNRRSARQHTPSDRARIRRSVLAWTYVGVTRLRWSTAPARLRRFQESTPNVSLRRSVADADAVVEPPTVDSVQLDSRITVVSLRPRRSSVPAVLAWIASVLDRHLLHATFGTVGSVIGRHERDERVANGRVRQDRHLLHATFGTVGSVIGRHRKGQRVANGRVRQDRHFLPPAAAGCPSDIPERYRAPPRNARDRGGTALRSRSGGRDA